MDGTICLVKSCRTGSFPSSIIRLRSNSTSISVCDTPLCAIFLINISVAGGIQRKMADKSIDIGKCRFLIMRLLYDFSRLPEEIFSGTLMQSVTDCIDRVRHQRMIIKQNIRSMQSYIIELFMFHNNAAGRVRNLFEHFLTHPVMCVCRWHILFPHFECIAFFNFCYIIKSGFSTLLSYLCGNLVKSKSNLCIPTYFAKTAVSHFQATKKRRIATTLLSFV